MVIVLSFPTILIILLVVRWLISLQGEVPEWLESLVSFLVGISVLAVAAIIVSICYFEPTVSSYISAIWDLIVYAGIAVCVASVVLSVGWLGYKIFKFVKESLNYEE